MDKDNIETIYITDVTRNGSGVGRGDDGVAVFVRGALPGDTVKCRITKEKKKYREAELTEIMEQSNDRVKSFCSFSEAFGEGHKQGCGGCPYAELSYDAQLRFKTEEIKQNLMRIGSVAEPVIKEPVGMRDPVNYRNKVTLKIGWQERNADSSGKVYRDTCGAVDERNSIGNVDLTWKEGSVPVVGFYRAGSHDIADCPVCRVQANCVTAIASAIRMFMMSDHISAYDPKTREGLLKNVIVRTGFATGEVMVIFEINEPSIPDAARLIDLINAQVNRMEPVDIPTIGTIDNPDSLTDGSVCSGPTDTDRCRTESADAACNHANKHNVSDIIQEATCYIRWSLESVYTITGKNAPVLLAGKPTIREVLSGVRYEISPMSFYQVNPLQTSKLYEKVAEYADLASGDAVIDLYCGVGSIGLFLASRMGGKIDVLGIESSKSAVFDANRNAVINGIVNARYLCGQAEKVLPNLKEIADSAGDEETQNNPDIEYAIDVIKHAKVAALDPPRSGCDRKLLMALSEVSPERIVYVSCDPATLARDVKILSENGYTFREATPVDMFPHTGHVETVVALSHQKAQQIH